MTDNPIEGGNIGPQIRAYVERVERIEGDIKDMNSDKADIYAEAKGNGFDVRALKEIVRLRRADPETRKERATILDMYLAALGME